MHVEKLKMENPLQSLQREKSTKLMVKVKLHGCNHGDQSSSDAEINEHNLFIFISGTDDER